MDQASSKQVATSQAWEADSLRAANVRNNLRQVVVLRSLRSFYRSKKVFEKVNYVLLAIDPNVLIIFCVPRSKPYG